MIPIAKTTLLLGFLFGGIHVLQATQTISGKQKNKASMQCINNHSAINSSFPISTIADSNLSSFQEDNVATGHNSTVYNEKLLSIDSLSSRNDEVQNFSIQGDEQCTLREKQLLGALCTMIIIIGGISALVTWR